VALEDPRRHPLVHVPERSGLERRVAVAATRQQLDLGSQFEGVHHLDQLVPDLLALDLVDVRDAPLLVERAVARQHDAPLVDGAADQGLVGDVGFKGTVEAQEPQPAGQSAQHGIRDEAPLRPGGATLARGQADATAAGAPERASELEQGDVVLASAARAGDRHGGILSGTTSHRPVGLHGSG
jgi:hypothetical protein